ncbi:MAG: VIT1/CCC1 transporter family protein [Spirochaetia bacterium]|nr:VIT1/CCC1 transporter family protein [Spirochaetia bacterium]
MNEKNGLSKKTYAFLLRFQKSELTEQLIYSRLAKKCKDKHNKEILQQVSNEEGHHASIWKQYTGKEQKPDMAKVRRVIFLARLLGLTFVLKMMENGEGKADNYYTKVIDEIPEAKQIIADENSHENALLKMLDEEKLHYVGSMVLGLSDAIVEISGTLAGLTFALANTRLIALSGLITGIAATLSMASSEFLSAKTSGGREAKKSAFYTGLTYLITVTLLILPYLLFSPAHYIGALVTMLVIVVLVIFCFSFYIAVAKDLPFRSRFLEMAGISLGVAAISFVIGLLVKQFLGISI